MGKLRLPHRFNRPPITTFCQFPIPFTTRSPALIEECSHSFSIRPSCLRRKNALIPSDWATSLTADNLSRPQPVPSDQSPVPQYQDPKSNVYITGRWGQKHKKKTKNQNKISISYDGQLQDKLTYGDNCTELSRKTKPKTKINKPQIKTKNNRETKPISEPVLNSNCYQGAKWIRNAEDCSSHQVVKTRP